MKLPLNAKDARRRSEARAKELQAKREREKEIEDKKEARKAKQAWEEAKSDLFFRTESAICQAIEAGEKEAQIHLKGEVQEKSLSKAIASLEYPDLIDLVLARLKEREFLGEVALDTHRLGGTLYSPDIYWVTNLVLKIKW